MYSALPERSSLRLLEQQRGWYGPPRCGLRHVIQLLRRAVNMHKIMKRCQQTFSISTLTLLAACINDTPYADNHSHIIVWVEGPGFVTMDTELTSEEHTAELQSRGHLACRLLLEKYKVEIAQ